MAAGAVLADTADGVGEQAGHRHRTERLPRLRPHLGHGQAPVVAVEVPVELGAAAVVHGEVAGEAGGELRHPQGFGDAPEVAGPQPGVVVDDGGVDDGALDIEDGEHVALRVAARQRRDRRPLARPSGEPATERLRHGREVGVLPVVLPLDSLDVEGERVLVVGRQRVPQAP